MIEDKIINYNIEIDTNRRTLIEHNQKFTEISQQYKKILESNSNKDQIEKYIQTFIRLKELLINGDIKNTKINDLMKLKRETEMMETAHERNTSRTYNSLLSNQNSQLGINLQYDLQRKEENYRSLLRDYFRENNLE